eukprot:6491726-Amphidinium_carterae.2
MSSCTWCNARVVWKASARWSGAQESRPAQVRCGPSAPPRNLLPRRSSQYQNVLGHVRGAQQLVPRDGEPNLV